jgi:hypothetical protein
MATDFLKTNNLRDKLQENDKGGIKDDSGKLEYSLLPWGALEQITKVLMHGARKYDRGNWKKVERIRYEDALMRHYAAWKQGEALDKDTGLSHLAHLGCCALFLLELYKDEPCDKD